MNGENREWAEADFEQLERMSGVLSDVLALSLNEEQRSIVGFLRHYSACKSKDRATGSSESCGRMLDNMRNGNRGQSFPEAVEIRAKDIYNRIVSGSTPLTRIDL